MRDEPIIIASLFIIAITLLFLAAYLQIEIDMDNSSVKTLLVSVFLILFVAVGFMSVDATRRSRRARSTDAKKAADEKELNTFMNRMVKAKRRSKGL